MEVIVAPEARGDIASILAWTEASFGLLTLKRYAKLIPTAIEQIAENPERAAVSGRRSPRIAEPIVSISDPAAQLLPRGRPSQLRALHKALDPLNLRRFVRTDGSLILPTTVIDWRDAHVLFGPCRMSCAPGVQRAGRDRRGSKTTLIFGYDGMKKHRDADCGFEPAHKEKVGAEQQVASARGIRPDLPGGARRALWRLLAGVRG